MTSCGKIYATLDLTKSEFLRPYDSTQIGIFVIKIYSDSHKKVVHDIKVLCTSSDESTTQEFPCFRVPISYERGQTIINKIVGLRLPGDTDQYSSYYAGIVPRSFIPINITLTNLNKCNYASLFLLNDNDVNFSDGIFFTTLQDSLFSFYVNNVSIPNPFLLQNLSPKCFDCCPSSQKNCYNHMLQDENVSQLPLYILDKETTVKLNFAGEEVTTSCLRTYILCPNYPTKIFPNVTNSFPFGVISIQLPFTFSTTSPCKHNPDYDMYYFSVSSMILNDDTRPLHLKSYWTINYRMMLKYASNDGHAYVFFAPREYLPNNGPCTITWGNRKGYLLGTPQVLYFRIKAPNTATSQYLDSLPCYDTPQTNQPIPDDQLKWIRVYGDDFTNWNDFIHSSRIGSLIRN